MADEPSTTSSTDTETATEAPSTEEGQGQEPTAEKVSDLPEWAQRQITKLRDEAASRRTALNEANEALSKAKSPEDFEAALRTHVEANAALERQLLIRDIASDAGLPKELGALLQGEDEEALRAHAETLRAFTPQKPKAPEPPADELGGGLDGSNGGGVSSMSPRELAGKRFPRTY